MDKFTAWWGGLPRRNQILTVTLGGIVAGVLLIATGIALVQLAGAMLIGLALLTARAGTRFPDAGWSDPRSHYPILVRSLQSRVPAWLWPLCVACLVVVLGIVLLLRLFTGEDLSTSMLENLGKGLIALAMIATLALWSTDRISPKNWIIQIRRRSEIGHKP